MQKNQLYYGDNLEVLRDYIKDESVDLIYLDPPFNSRQDYNVLFKEKDGSKSSSQIMAFEDTWEWNTESKGMYEELVGRGDKVSDVMRAFHTFIHGSDMMAYLAMMAPRLIGLHRVLKVTGSIYLHCDPTASHYLKLLMDAIFGASNFRNEVVWQRTNAHNTAKQYGRVHDVLLFYTKGDAYTWNSITTPFGKAQLKRYKEGEDGRPCTGQDLTASRPNSSSGKWKWRGTMPPSNRGWGYELEQLEEWWEKGLILTRRDGSPRMDGLKVYLDEKEGKNLQSVWTDIPRIPNTSPERLGYPTQKPEALLERIINSSSNEGEVVLDPFCGCDTAVAASQKLKRRWIGIDVTHLAIGLIKQRLQDAFGIEVRNTYEVIGEPTDLESAKVLASQNRFQFQAWALGLVGARRATSSKKGADHGIDGKLFFRDAKDDLKQVILSVKSGGVQVKDVRDLVGTVDREKAEIGVLITLEGPTAPMKKEAVDAGFFKSENFKDKVPRIQILTIGQLLNGARIDFPHLAEETFKQAPKAKGKKPENLTLDLG
jgi:site-specific DNA-methyltransferase (adenine-specific)